MGYLTAKVTLISLSIAMPENKNQHYIPIKLLSQFLIPGKDKITYKHRKEIIKEESIRNLFSNDYYYGKQDSEEYVDDIITRREHEYVNILLPVLLENDGKLSRSNKRLAADFIAHFLLRRSLNRDLILKSTEHYYVDKKDEDNVDSDFISFISLYTKDPLLNLFKKKGVFSLLIFLLAFGIEIRKMNVSDDRQKLKRRSKNAHNKIIALGDNHENVSRFFMGFNWKV
jgi:hypothetical protein